MIDKELEDKLALVRRQHEIDKIFDMPPLDFASGLLDFYKKDYFKRIGIDPIIDLGKKGDPIALRRKVIDDGIFNSLMNK